MKNILRNTIFAGVISASSLAFADNPSAAISTEGSGKQTVAEVPSSYLWDAARPDSHAPIGVMGDHTHGAGEVMLSYRYMYMSMNDNYVGDDKISDAKVISPTGEGYLVTPTSMDMHMHMLGGMWAPSDKITLMLMVPYTLKSMDHLRRDGRRFNTESDGFGDLTLNSLIKVIDAKRQRVHLNIGISAPTGSITEKGFVPGPGNTQLPYPMQLGSGSWDLLPGVTYLGQHGNWSWGAQFMANVRLETNSQGYRLGDAYSLTGWGAYKWSDWVSTSLRVVQSTWDDISGQDSSLAIPAGVVPTADPSLRGGDRLDLFAGINLYMREGFLKGHRFALEAGGPVYQDLNGPQLGNEWMLMVGWQKAW